MELKKIEKYLQIYLDEVIIPKANEELSSGENDEPIKMKVWGIKPSQTHPDQYLNVFIDVNPFWKGSFFDNYVTKGIESFFKFFTLEVKPLVRYNTRPEKL